MSSARAADLPPLRSEAPPLFTADAAISLDPDGRPALSVSITVPYEELQWLRTAPGYGAAAEFTVVFDPQGRDRDFGDVWERRAVIAAFAATNSSVLSLAEKRTFDVPPGRYEMRVSVRDLNGQSLSSARQRIVVPDYSRVPVGFADLELGVTDPQGAFAAVPTRRFGHNVERLAARVTLFDRRPGDWPRHYPFRFRILDETGSELMSGRREVTLGHSAEAVVVRPDSTNLFLGNYVFEIELSENRSRWRVERSFEVEESGPPRGKEFDQMLEPLSYVANDEEIEYLRTLQPEAQARGWEEFWKRRDPTPDTPRNEALLEFFRRVRYAERHFQGFGPGWRSDMGRIYIKFGAPDQVESRPPTLQSPQLEVWYYNQPTRRFVFADRQGFGRYELVGPAIE